MIVLYNELGNIKTEMMKVENLSNETYTAIYTGLLRSFDERIYFDIINYDVLTHTSSGHFSSLLGDQGLENRKLMNRIMSGDFQDYVDDSRHILIDQISYKTFINEFIFQSERNKPIISLSKKFLESIVQPDDPFGEYGVQEFINFFEKNAENPTQEFVTLFTEIYNKTQKGLAISWLTTNIL